MSLMKSFINDPKNFESKIREILAAGKPDHFNKDFLITCGFNESNSILYSNLFISLGLIDEKGVPAPDYDRFLKSEADSRTVIAEKIWDKYTPIFAEDRHIQDKPIEKISEVFRKLYGNEHSESFVHLLALTFKALIDYADLKSTKKIFEPELVAAEIYTNGVSDDSSDEVRNERKETGDGEIDESLLTDPFAELDDEEKTENKIDEYSDSILENDHQEILDDLCNDSEHPENDKKKDTGEPDTYKKETPKMNDTDTLINKSVQTDINGNDFLLKALFKRANLLKKLDRVEDEVQALEQIVEYFDNSGKHPENEEILSKTIIRKAEILEQIGDDEKTLAAYEDYIQRFYKKE